MSASKVGRPRVAVIGAGLTGLLTAQGLKKNGFEVVVFERESSIDARPRDWTIVLHWAMPTMAKLLPDDMLKSLPKAICNPHLDFNEDVETLPCYNGVTGEILFKNAMPGARRVSRQRLRVVLAEGLEIKWGKSLSQLSQTSGSVRMTFEDGESCDAEYILGTDGTSSKVRELLLGVEAARPLPSGFMFATGIVQYRDVDKVDSVLKTHPVAAVVMGMDVVGGCGVMYVDDPEDRSTWTTFWVKIWKGQSANLREQDAIKYIKENTKGLCEPFQSQIDWTPDDSTCYIDEMKYWVPVPFGNYSGRVTLAGDAAHPMLVYRGQGFQHAITDASNYVDALLKIKDSGDAKAREEVMTAYAAEMIERGAKAVKQSLQEAEFSMDINTVGKMLMKKQGHGRSA